jgi:uncharacterized membrane protein YeaQ/YmgE (transglycosylase-associated protein family)
MGFLTNIIVGAIVGWLASIIAKTNNQMGCLWNIVVGIVGAALGNWIASAVAHRPYVSSEFTLTGFLISLGGAVVLIFILRTIGILKRD